MCLFFIHPYTNLTTLNVTDYQCFHFIKILLYVGLPGGAAGALGAGGQGVGTGGGLGEFVQSNTS